MRRPGNLKKSSVSSKLSVVPPIEYSQQTEPMLYEINRWITFCRSNGLSKTSLNNYNKHIMKFYWWYSAYAKLPEKVGKDLSALTPDHMREYVAYLREPVAFRWGKKVVKGKEKLSAASVSTLAKTVRVFLNWITDEKVIPVSPFNRSVKITTSKDPVRTNHHKNLAEIQLAHIFAYLTDPDRLSTFTGMRNYAIVSLLLDSGMRQGELVSMRLCDVDFDRSRVVIRGKTGERVCFFSPSTRAALLDYYNDYRKKLKNQLTPQSKFWMTPYKREFAAGGVERMLQRVSEACGVDFSAHKFRHTFASIMVNRVGIYELKELLGHSSLVTTQIYTHTNPDKLQNVYVNNSPLSILDVGQKKGRRGPGRPKGAKNIRQNEDE